MEVLFSDVFVKSLKKHSSIKKDIQKKADMIIENPIALGEPLKGTFRGYYSSPVKKNFLIIYLYCKACRARGDDKIVLCKDCTACKDETIKFVDIGPHDETYKKKSYWS
jgi:mRNA-degrading endonuclease YafQ of YafQ-DinJ toxin-antitoxin module